MVGAVMEHLAEPDAKRRVELEAADSRIDRDEGSRPVRVHLGRHAARPAAELEHDLLVAGADRAQVPAEVRLELGDPDRKWSLHDQIMVFS